MTLDFFENGKIIQVINYIQLIDKFNNLFGIIYCYTDKDGVYSGDYYVEGDDTSLSNFEDPVTGQ